MGQAAKLRQLACSGQEKAAVEIATALTDIGARASALGIVAEGLAGIPGFSDEKSRRLTRRLPHAARASAPSIMSMVLLTP